MKISILVVAAISLGVAARQVGHAQDKTTQGQVATFRIVVEPSAKGLKATCLNGCAWKELTFGCELPGKQPCKAEIDQAGVSGVR
jgi:hypothetical protein